MSKYNNILVGKGGVDKDALAYLKKLSARTTQIDNAWKNFVRREKNANRWVKAKAIYPLIGGTAANNKWNAKNPQDTDAAHRLSFMGTVTHTADGIQGDGSTGYARTFLTPATHFAQNNFAAFVFSRDTSASDPDTVYYSDFGCYDVNQAGNGVTLYTRTPVNTFHSRCMSVVDTISYNKAYGFHGISRVSNTYYNRVFPDAISTATVEYSSPLSLEIPLIALRRQDNALVNYSSRPYSFFWFGEGLSNSDAEGLRTSVEILQADLGRLIYETEAQALFNVVTTLTNTQKVAWNNFVKREKAAERWAKATAIYPLLGGTATNHKWNAKNVSDTNGAYRLTFGGTVNHSSAGMQSDGTTGYADTYLAPTVFGLNSIAGFFYTRSEIQPGGNDFGVLQSVDGTINIGFQHNIKNSAGNRVARNNSDIVTNIVDTNPVPGFYGNSRIASDTFDLIYPSGVDKPTITAIKIPTQAIQLMGVYQVDPNVRTNFISNRVYSFFWFGQGLTESESSGLKSSVIKLQTDLERSI